MVSAVVVILMCPTLVLFVLLLLGGYHGCTFERVREEAVNDYWRLRFIRSPSCEKDSDCSAERCPWSDHMPYCLTNYGSPGGTHYPFCWCRSIFYWEYPDGGTVGMFCRRNPDGGTPICGQLEKDARGGLIGIKGEDGGLIVDKDGGVF
jgi:hypothetical protein